MTLLYGFCFAAFLVLVVLLARLARLPWQVKLGLTLAAGLSVLGFVSRFDAAMGWPAQAALTGGKLELLWFEVHEPAPGDPGSLLLLTRAPNQEPRLRRLPYDKAAHEVLEQSRKKAKKGLRTFLDSEPAQNGDFAGDDEVTSPWQSRPPKLRLAEPVFPDKPH